MAIKEIFDFNTDKIDLATELLSELSDREGQYVWKNILPPGYKRVEYIESTGTQFIDTGIIPASGYTAEVGFTATYIPSDDTIESWILSVFDMNVSSYPCMRVGLVGSSYWSGDTNGATYNGSPGEYTVANVGVSKAGCTLSLYLFSAHEKNGAAHTANSKYKFDYYKVRNASGVIVGFGVACVTPSGEAGVYDVVNGEFHGNLGTGTFVVGKTIATGGFVVADDENAYSGNELYNQLIAYTGANPLTIGENGVTIPANTILETALQILNGVQAGIPLPAPLTKWSIRTINNGSTLKASSAEIQHGLDVLPRIIIVSQSVYSSMNNTIRYAIMMDSQASYDNRSGNCSGILHYWFIGGASNTEISATTTASTFRMNQDGIYYERNCEYTILALA